MTNIQRVNPKRNLLTVTVLWMIRYGCFGRVEPQSKHGMCKCVEGHIPKPLPLCCRCHARNIILIIEGILTPTTVWYSRLSCPVLHWIIGSVIMQFLISKIPALLLHHRHFWFIWMVHPCQTIDVCVPKEAIHWTQKIWPKAIYIKFSWIHSRGCHFVGRSVGGVGESHHGTFGDAWYQFACIGGAQGNAVLLERTWKRMNLQCREKKSGYTHFLK